MYGLSGTAFNLADFLAGAFINASPGIVIQRIIIPANIVALKKAYFIEDKRQARLYSCIQRTSAWRRVDKGMYLSPSRRCQTLVPGK